MDLFYGGRKRIGGMVPVSVKKAEEQEMECDAGGECKDQI